MHSIYAKLYVDNFCLYILRQIPADSQVYPYKLALTNAGELTLTYS